MKRLAIRIIGYTLTAGALGLMAGCAKSATTNENESLERYLEAWMSTNHPGISENSNGIYILEDEPGSGVLYDEDTHDYVYLDYVVTDLDGTITSSTTDSLAKQLGTYVDYYYYGPKVWATGESYMSAGVEFVLDGMREGGRRKAVIPGWYFTTSRYSNASSYFTEVTGNDNSIYDLSVVEFIDDIIEWQIDSIESYSNRVYGRADSLEYGLYYYTLQEASDTTTFSADTSFYVNYIGRRLDGTIFDTNIEKVAKKAGLYSSSKTYGPATISWDEDDYTEITMKTAGSSSASSTINGFARALYKIRSYEKCVVIFTSAWGYGSSGSGSAIPPYSPLEFEIEFVDNES